MKPQTSKLLSSICLIVAMLVIAACGGAPTTAAPAPTQAPATEAPTSAPAATESPATVAPTEAPAATEAATAAPTAEAGAIPAVLNMPKEIACGRPVEITVAGAPPDSQPDLLAGWKASADRFMALYPNVKITGSDYTYTPDSFAALVAGKQVPTLFQVYFTDPGKMVDQGIAADLTSFFDAQHLTSIYNPQIMSLVSVNGKVYGIPMKAYAMGLAYNIPMLKAAGFDTPPATWDELATMAQKLTNRDNGVAGLSFITDGSGATGWHMTTIAYNFGLLNTDIVKANADGSYSSGFNSPAMISALAFAKDLRWKYDVLPRENLDWPKNGEALATDRAAMVVMAGDQFTWIRQTYPDAKVNDFGFAPLPAGVNGKSVSLIGGDVAMVSAAATPDQIEAAAYFRLWYQLDPGEIQARFDAGQKDPANVVGAPQLPLFVGDYQTATAALEKKYANLPVKNYSLFEDGIASGKVGVMPEPLIAGQEYYSALGTVVSQIVTDQATDPTAAVNDAAKTFQTNVLANLK